MTMWKRTTSILFAGIAIGGCTPQAPVAAPIGTVPPEQARISFVTSVLTQEKVEYEWEIQTDRSWRSGVLKGGTATFSEPIDGEPETRRIRVILEAKHRSKGTMDVKYTHVDAHRSPHANGETRAEKEFVGIPARSLDSLVTLALTKPTEVKTPSRTRLAELRIPASKAVKLGVKKRAVAVPIEVVFRDKASSSFALGAAPSEVSYKDL